MHPVLIALLQLTIRARVAAAERWGRTALADLDVSHPGFAVAEQALDRVAAWQHDPAVGGASLLDSLLNDREEGVFAFLDAQSRGPSELLFNLVGGAVSLAAWHAFRWAGEPIPEGFEEDEDVLLEWLVTQALQCPRIAEAGAWRVIADLSVKHTAGDGNCLGEPVLPQEGT